MRGRLPDTTPKVPLDPASLDTLEREEYLHIKRVERSYLATIESDLKRLPEVRSTAIHDSSLVSQLNGLMHVVESVLCEVPSSSKRKVFDSICWDDNTCQLLIKHWAQPVVLRADFHLLKAMAMHQIGDALSKLSQQSRAEVYFNLAQSLMDKAFDALRAINGFELNKPTTQFWRYECLAARIHVSLAALNHAKVKASPIELPAARGFLQTAKSHYCQAMDHFLVGIKLYPSNTFPENGKQSFKELECCFFAEKIAEYSKSHFEHLADASAWIENTTTLFSLAIRSTKQQCHRAYYLHRIARLHLDHAMISFRHPEAVIESFPEKNHHFYSLQEQAIAATVYANQSVDEARAEGLLRPQHLSLTIECHLMLAACVTSASLNAWYHRVATDLTHSLTQFTNYNPSKDVLQTILPITPRAP
ncbi:hypothetical protein BGZ73_007237 [Actinomortierella ambigua]|nr:hypothetical protein BGZ73_007237 [Actinomortierella ambigua]